MPAAPTKPSSSSLSLLNGYFERVRDQFHLQHNEVSKWLEANALELHQFQTSVQQAAAAVSLIGALATNKPVDAQVFEQLAQDTDHKADQTLAEVTQEEYDAIIAKMKGYVQQPPGHLPEQEELYLEQQLSDLLGFEVAAELEGHKLNHSIGIMGGEQHLPRFPGDTIDQHDAVREAGITANRGAFGWFTEGGVLTDRAIAREKYYFAVQTLYLPDWNTNHKELKPWYAFRKMIAINPAEELAVVGVVGDAGPAQWVNKQFGGSPEVIRETKIWSKESRGRVLLYFVDDPEDTIPLGVINLHELRGVATKQLASAGEEQ
jgi:hypothetical protein